MASSKSNNPDGRDTRERLLDAAIEEFALRGYDLGTVRNICKKAGANLNAVNYHFEDKQGLYVEAVRKAHRTKMLARGMVAVDEIAEQFSGSPEQRLRAFIDGMVGMAMAALDRSDVNHLLMFREIANPTVATEHIVHEFIAPHFERLNLILTELLPPGTPAFERRLLGFSVIGQCMHYKVAGPIMEMLLTDAERKRLKPQRVAQHIGDVILADIDVRWKKSGKKRKTAAPSN